MQRKFIEFIVKCKIKQVFAILSIDLANQLILAYIDKIVQAEVLPKFYENDPASIIKIYGNDEIASLYVVDHHLKHTDVCKLLLQIYPNVGLLSPLQQMSKVSAIFG